MPGEKVLDRIQANSGKHFYLQVVTAFMERDSYSIFPT